MQDNSCVMSVTVPVQHWFAVVEHNKGTAVWVVMADSIQDAHRVVKNKAQSMYSGLDWELKLSRLDCKLDAIVGSHEVRFDNDNRET